MQRTLFLFFLPLMLITCSSTDYEIIKTTVSGNECIMTVNLTRKMDGPELAELCHKIKAEHCQQENLSVDFFVPSAYPDYPLNMWARAYVHQQCCDFTIFGTRTEALKAEMTEKCFTGTHLGKWYLNDPVDESVFVLVKDGDSTRLEKYQHVSYMMHYCAGEKKEITQKDDVPQTPIRKYRQVINGNDVYYAHPIYEGEKYRIDNEGNLICEGEACNPVKKLKKLSE